MDPSESRLPDPPAGAIRKWVNRILQGTQHHYPNILPDRLGPWMSTTLRLFYSGVRLEDPQVRALRELPADGIVIYATRFRFVFPFLFVQLANFTAALDQPAESDWAELREAQQLATRGSCPRWEWR